MKVPPTCPRCAAPVREPGLWTSAWRCDVHGEVQPYQTAGRLSPEALAAVAEKSKVPLWVPHPMMAGWVVSGLGYAGDERVGARATVLCCSGPSPLGGPADMVLVAEEPGIGLGARFAGLEGADPGSLVERAPDAKIEAADHPTPLWNAAGAEDRVVLVGEARGLWLWAVLWPPNASVMFVDTISLADAREFGPAAYEMLGYGALSPRMAVATQG